MRELHALSQGDHLRMGHDAMDELHDEFVLLISQLQQADDSQLPALLQAMEVHLQKHFAEEDAWMAQTAFPPRKCHMDEHAAVLKSVGEVRDRLASGHVGICPELIHALADWFPGHVTHLDSALAHWLSKLRFGAKPVVLRRGVSSSATAG